MPGPDNQHSLASYSESILEAMEKLRKESVRTATFELRTSVLGETAAQDNSLSPNVTVSFDGFGRAEDSLLSMA